MRAGALNLSVKRDVLLGQHAQANARPHHLVEKGVDPLVWQVPLRLLRPRVRQSRPQGAAERTNAREASPRPWAHLASLAKRSQILES